MNGRERDVMRAMGDPDKIRESTSDLDVFLFYRLEQPRRWICAVVKRVSATDGFLITTWTQ